MSQNVQPGDLVQCRLTRGQVSYVTVRPVFSVLQNGDLIVIGGEHGRHVLRANVFCVIPVDGVCADCQCRPCECEEEFEL
jgi:hypothetical protein